MVAGCYIKNREIKWLLLSYRLALLPVSINHCQLVTDKLRGRVKEQNYDGKNSLKFTCCTCIFCQNEQKESCLTISYDEDLFGESN